LTRYRKYEATNEYNMMLLVVTIPNLTKHLVFNHLIVSVINKLATRQLVCITLTIIRVVLFRYYVYNGLN